jgi:hypothetical protein
MPWSAYSSSEGHIIKAPSSDGTQTLVKSKADNGSRTRGLLSSPLNKGKQQQPVTNPEVEVIQVGRKLKGNIIEANYGEFRESERQKA